MNQVIITGNLGKDPTVRMTKAGKAVATFSVANSRKNGDDFLTTWINVVVWGKLAESVGNQLKKGARVIIAGRWQSRSYEQNGQKRWATEVVADEVGMLLQKAESKGNFNQYGAPAEDNSEPIPF